MRDRCFRVSWIALAVSPLPPLLVPVVLLLIDDGRPGWDQLPDQLTAMFLPVYLSLGLLLLSFGTGLFAWRRRRIALLWVVPLGGLVLIALGWLVALFVAPHWQADWL